MDYETLLRELPRLSKVQLGKVKARVVSLMGFSSDPRTQSPHGPDDWLLDGFVEVLRARGLSSSIPPQKLWSQLTHKTGYDNAAPPIKDALEKALSVKGGTLQRLELETFGRIAADCLCDYLDGWGEISFQGLCRATRHIPTALNEAFPGYLRAGMLGFLLRTRRSNYGPRQNQIERSTDERPLSHEERGPEHRARPVSASEG